MNLYKIVFSSSGPKHTDYGMKCLLFADSPEEVYEWIKSEPKIDGFPMTNTWKYSVDDTFEIYDNKYKVIGTETFKEKMLRIGGEVHDEDYDFDDAHYGITLYGWELMLENVPNNFQELVDAGLIKTVK